MLGCGTDVMVVTCPRLAPRGLLRFHIICCYPFVARGLFVLSRLCRQVDRRLYRWTGRSLTFDLQINLGCPNVLYDNNVNAWESR